MIVLGVSGRRESAWNIQMFFWRERKKRLRRAFASRSHGEKAD